MAAMPGATPVTTPVNEPTVATPVLLLDHVPPPVALLSVAEVPVQIEVGPVITAGAAMTVIVLFA
jgi:hypothetical protein